LLSELAGLMAHPRMARHEEDLARLERLSLAYIISALRSLGWGFSQGPAGSTAGIASALGVVNRHRELLGRLLEILSENRILKRDGPLWEVVSPPETEDAAAWIDPAPAQSPEMALLSRCGSKLGEVLQGKLDPMELLFPGGDVTEAAAVYAESAMPMVMNTLVRKTVLRAWGDPAAGQGCRILEIGAGTGGTTAHVLPHLPPARAEYVFTDISPAFTDAAQKRFAEFPFVQYRTLNIERPPQEQGFDPFGYHMVIAANVFHATRSLAVTLHHAGKLLAPGGSLVLLEITAPVAWLDLTFGLTQGWWRFDDTDLRPSHPLVPAAKWVALLRDEGCEPAFSVSPEDLSGEGSASWRRRVLPLSLVVGKAPSAGPGA
jgi:SAM-dependent methyltransferase